MSRIPFNAKNCTFSLIGCISPKGLLHRVALWEGGQRIFHKQDVKFRDSGQTVRHTASLRKQCLSFQYSENCWRAARFDAYAIRTLKSVIQDGRLEVKLINISKRGALIESPKRRSLRSRIFLQFITAEDAYLLEGRIIRCRTLPVNDKVIKYQYAILFNEDFAVLPELLT